MGTSTYGYEGTPGAIPGTPTTGYASWSWYSVAGDASDGALTSGDKNRGSMCLELNSASVLSAHYATSVAATTSGRLYVKLTAAPTRSVALGYVYGSSFGQVWVIGLTASRELFVNRTPTGDRANAGYKTTANIVPIGEWFRVEWQITATSATARLWTNANRWSSGTADYEVTHTGASIGAFDQVGVGAWATDTGGSSAAFLSSGEKMRLDDLAVSDAGWIGPEAPDSGTSYAGIVRI